MCPSIAAIVPLGSSFDDRGSPETTEPWETLLSCEQVFALDQLTRSTLRLAMAV
jgi:hypothetical protein